MWSDKFTRRLAHLNVAILSAFLLITLSLLYWVIVAPDVLEREDNPRLVENEWRIVRGQILDTNGVILAQSLSENSAVFPPARTSRVYPLADAGPAVGYYSFRHGTAGVEAGLDELLRGEAGPWDELRHTGQQGADVRLTLDVEWQQAAAALMEGRQGAVLLMTLPDAALRAVVSTPSYDPNLLDAQFDELTADERAPLLNRVTQGLYQPGLLLHPFLLGAAADRGILRLLDPVNEIAAPWMVGENMVACGSEPPAGSATHATALQNGCPTPLAQLAEQMDADELTQILGAFGFLSEPELPLATESSAPAPIEDLANALIGQDALTLSPLQVGLAWGMLAMEGRLPTARLVEAVRESEGQWRANVDELSQLERPLSAESAAIILANLPSEAGVIFHNLLVLSGPEGTQHSWFLGLAPAGAPQFAVVVIVEDNANLTASADIGHALLRLVAFGEQE